MGGGALGKAPCRGRKAHFRSPETSLAHNVTAGGGEAADRFAPADSLAFSCQS